MNTEKKVYQPRIEALEPRIAPTVANSLNHPPQGNAYGYWSNPHNPHDPPFGE